MQKCVIITSYTVDDLEWDSSEDYQQVKERHGTQPIYFVYERSWTDHNVHTNIPDLYQESRECSVIRRECRPNNA